MGYSLAVGENAHSPRPRAARAITPTPHIFLPDPLETPVAAENACTGHTSPQLNILFWRRQEQDELQQPLYALSSSQKAKDSFLFAISLLQLAETVAGPKRRALIRRDLSSLIGCRVEALGLHGRWRGFVTSSSPNAADFTTPGSSRLVLWPCRSNHGRSYKATPAPLNIERHNCWQDCWSEGEST